jgi:hypothetical protein
MDSVHNKDGCNRQRLEAELQAIELWNTDFWRKSDPEAYEMLAHAARRERRSEILAELLTLIPRLTKVQGGALDHKGINPDRDKRTASNWNREPRLVEGFVITESFMDLRELLDLYTPLKPWVIRSQIPLFPCLWPQCRN